jgi:methylase of polypeptide subunit release factors
LLTPAGQDALAAAEALLREEKSDLAALTRLRGRFPVPLASAAFDQATLRQRALAGGKFALGAEMYFTRDGLEQATGEAVARHRARRYAPYGMVADLACGIGGDVLALALAHPVLAIDRDRLRLSIARENARINGVAARMLPLCADLLTLPTPRADALFCDPGRRTAEGRRIHSVEGYQPPLSLVASWRAAVPRSA